MPNNIQNGECCTPAGCMTIVDGITSTDGSSNNEDGEIVKVLCNNEHCPTSGLMHRQCFDQWEASVLHYLRSCGRARSWSERQRSQNLWTKKGYDLAFKVNQISFQIKMRLVQFDCICCVRPAGVCADVAICAKIANGCPRNRWKQQLLLAKMSKRNNNNNGANRQQQ